MPSCWGNDRTVLHGRELDVYVPEHHIAMEYDGLYWHSEDAGRDKGYHRRKTDDCAAAGISLVHVWEDDRRDRRAIIEDMIAYTGCMLVIGCGSPPVRLSLTWAWMLVTCVGS